MCVSPPHRGILSGKKAALDLKPSCTELCAQHKFQLINASRLHDVKKPGFSAQHDLPLSCPSGRVYAERNSLSGSDTFHSQLLGVGGAALIFGNASPDFRLRPISRLETKHLFVLFFFLFFWGCFVWPTRWSWWEVFFLFWVLFRQFLRGSVSSVHVCVCCAARTYSMC